MARDGVECGIISKTTILAVNYIPLATENTMNIADKGGVGSIYCNTIEGNDSILSKPLYISVNYV